ncbi:MAG: hypothetical protein L0211_25155 [Planctomycetaceae bacterium]|nr:hypothetical protein [Planctomycetaceae bacterium]
MLTGVSVEADAPSYIEGQTAWFSFWLSEPAPESFQLDLLVSGPAGPTGYVMPIAQGQTSAHVDFPTTDNSTPGDSYTLSLAITGSSEPGATGPFDSALTQILDNDGGGASGQSGPGGPVTITFDEPPQIYEGIPFVLTGTISPPGYDGFDHLVDYDYGGCSFDPQSGEFGVWLLIPDDGPDPEDDTPSPVEQIEIEMQAWGASATTTLTVHNVAPSFYNQYNQLLIDIYDYPPGGPSFVVSGGFYDPGSDTHVVTIDWGDESAPTVIPNGEILSASHTYEPDGGNYTITVTATDDDTGVGTYTETISMYLLDLDNDANNDGYINADDDPIEDVPPGAYIMVNSDNDNDTEIPEIVDMFEDGPIPEENDLKPMLIQWSPRAYASISGRKC